MNKVGGGPLKISLIWKSVWIVYSIAAIIYTGYLLYAISSEDTQFSFSDNGLHLVSAVMCVPIAGYYLWLAFNPYNSIKWDGDFLHIRFRKRKDGCTLKRSEIESVDLRLNDLHIKKKNGEELHFDVTDMYFSYSEINYFRKDFPPHSGS